ncbi:MAG: phosphonoacetaldehyde hydrolase [Planctomycetaceae bacterium]|nr:MAG: phosphonoacetaldehyde hydrolase [Planctomycetaceae bacterium]
MTNPWKAVLFDWAGTTVDYGSRAPAEVFIEIFRRRGVEISVAEAREPMGRAKPDHIAAIAATPRVAALWRERYGRDPRDSDVQSMYQEFLPLQKETLARGSDVIPGVPAAVAALRDRGIKIGSSTGYTRELMDVVAPIAARGGYSPDAIICADDVPAGRPAPWMNFLAAQRLNVYPMSAIVVVDDTPVGIEAGLNAGAVTVAVTQTGNALGLSEEDVARLPAVELQSRVAAIGQGFLAQGAQHIIKSVADLPELLWSVAAR